MPRESATKLVVTLGPEVSKTLRLRTDWFSVLCEVLPRVKQHAAMCLFKTLVGGWTTSHRMHEPDKLPCIFGCRDAPDDLRHYILCSPLWQICSQVLGVEAPLQIGERVCVVCPSPERVQLLALCFQVYHYAKTRAKELGGYQTVGSHTVQTIAFESAHTFLHHVK